MNKFENVDLFDGLNTIEDGSIDLLLTDPPYNVSMKSGFHTMGRKGVDFGDWDKGFDQTAWIDAAAPKVRKGGSVVIFNDYKNIGTMTEALARNGFTVKEMLMWKKPNPMPRNRDRLYVTTIEVALWAVRGKGWTFNRSRENYENAIFEATPPNHRARLHPTEKPVTLLSEIMAVHSNPGDVVLDCFAGSGSTLEAAIRGGRNFVGFEIDPEMFQKAQQRVNDCMAALSKDVA